MHFDNLIDFNRRMYRLAEHEGALVAPCAPWIVTNKTTGIHKVIPAEWPFNRKVMRDGCARVPTALAA